jgi:hypothetical protein
MAAMAIVVSAMPEAIVQRPVNVCLQTRAPVTVRVQAWAPVLIPAAIPAVAQAVPAIARPAM